MIAFIRLCFFYCLEVDRISVSVLVSVSALNVEISVHIRFRSNSSHIRYSFGFDMVTAVLAVVILEPNARAPL